MMEADSKAIWNLPFFVPEMAHLQGRLGSRVHRGELEHLTGKKDRRYTNLPNGRN